ncbi:hypothetical protein ACEWY4_001750 [Coilia grayii]|uniref:NAD(P)(+)--arginine ADP-ribosyltransferase n=1 Tax=Coilia grayii TaxID=363190 RepID=A0ABD1KTW3_9TELE
MRMLSSVIAFGLLLQSVPQTLGAEQTVYVLEGGTAVLELQTGPDPDLHTVAWHVNGTRRLVTWLPMFHYVDVSEQYAGRVEVDNETFVTFSLRLRAVQRNDSGVYTGGTYRDPDTLARYRLFVLVEETFTDSAFTLSIESGVVICNHSNPVSWRDTTVQMDQKCWTGATSPPADVCLFLLIPVSLKALLLTAALITMGVYICASVGGSVTLATPHTLQWYEKVLLRMSWDFNRTQNILTYQNTESASTQVSHAYEGRVGFDAISGSLTLTQLRKNDTGIYTLKIYSLFGSRGMTEWTTTLLVFESVATPSIVVASSPPSDADSCAVTVKCHSNDLSLTSTCNTSACSETDITYSNHNLKLSVINGYITCNHSNPSKPATIYKLDMAESSVDAEFLDCAEAVSLKNQLKPTIETFPGYNKFAKSCVQNHATPGCTGLKMYTSEEMYKGKKLYAAFNEDTRTGREAYTARTYRWYSLYYQVTRAVQYLKSMQPGCKTTYRGTGVQFDKNVQGKEIRLGSFTSSSLKPSVAKGFGSESCFEIQTCHGALISQYSVFKNEDEVLIPPYEVFKVSAVHTGGSKPDFQCKTVYVLESVGTRSYLNCHLLSPKPKTVNHKSFWPKP